MVLYNASGDFFHGYHEADTGLVRPYGLAMVQASDPGYLAFTILNPRKCRIRNIEYISEEKRKVIVVFKQLDMNQLNGFEGEG